jgi:hypothetical protein
MIDSNMNIHIRKVFNLFDLIGSLGGVLDIFIMMFAFLFSISEQDFILGAISKWYLTRTKDPGLFESSKCKIHLHGKFKLDN